MAPSAVHEVLSSYEQQSPWTKGDGYADELARAAREHVDEVIDRYDTTQVAGGGS
jgi:hypothetical protein